MRAALLGLGVALLLPAAQAGAFQMYKCVDAKGVTHYSEKPVAGCKGKEVDIKPSPLSSGARTAPATQDVGEQEREFRRRQLERGQAEEKDAAARREREQRCKVAKSDLERMSNSRLAVRNAKGEREFLDDTAAAARISKQQEEVRKSCG